MEKGLFELAATGNGETVPQSQLQGQTPPDVVTAPLAVGHIQTAARS